MSNSKKRHVKLDYMIGEYGEEREDKELYLLNFMDHKLVRYVGVDHIRRKQSKVSNDWRLNFVARRPKGKF